MADMRGFIGIDVSVLYDAFGLSGSDSARAGMHRLRKSRGKKCGAIEKEVDVTRAGQFHTSHSRDRANFGGDLLRDLPWRAPQPLGQFEGDRRGHFAHSHVRRPLSHDRDVLDAASAQEFAERRANPRFNDVIHGNSVATFSWERFSSK